MTALILVTWNASTRHELSELSDCIPMREAGIADETILTMEEMKHALEKNSKPQVLLG